ncbi:CHAT domain-containing protein/tetratricopeptide (TPR) repeat protein [Allocatelliglobosispora scoriae]|uniref:CHAT domain-containing protein/tetratricopeptide (TPR) repeat protein n=1 Tax=Allocatelliglobosispora scoriae TaxID=643052 RepID=A0A841BL22_9ACTN|nr:CHAT domain-containing protein [Allocatelliglobosispora scoriae]MBB5867442.1 CHAT domain-containing protein/tetratricopeptide (TPR) repeat protein [Allocatelliglobosispora scoriae]
MAAQTPDSSVESILYACLATVREQRWLAALDLLRRAVDQWRLAADAGDVDSEELESAFALARIIETGAPGLDDRADTLPLVFMLTGAYAPLTLMAELPALGGDDAALAWMTEHSQRGEKFGIKVERGPLDLFHDRTEIARQHTARAIETRDRDTLEEALRLYELAFGNLPEDAAAEAHGEFADYAVAIRLLADLEDSFEGLDAAIEAAGLAVELTPDGHPELGTRLANLARMLRDRYDRTRDRRDLDDVISCGEDAVAAHEHGGDPAIALTNLAAALYTRFELDGDGEDLDRAVELCRSAVQGSQPGDDRLSRRTAMLAILLRDRWTGTADRADLDGVIAAAEQHLTLQGDPSPVVSHFLLLSLRDRFAHEERRSDLDRAIEIGELLTARPDADDDDDDDDDDDGHQQHLHVLQELLMARYRLGGDPGDLRAAAAVIAGALAEAAGGRQLLDAEAAPTVDDVARWLARPQADQLRDLHTSALDQLFATSEPITDHVWQQAHGTLRQVVAAADDRTRPRYLANLGYALWWRFRHTGEAGLLDEAIVLAQEAVGQMPDGHEDRVAALTTLSAMLQSRYDWSGAPADIRQAVDIQRELTGQVPPDAARASILGNLGIVLISRFDRLASPHDLDEAADVLRTGLAELEPDDPDRARLLSSLGLALRTRFGLTGAGSDLDEAVDLARAAVDLAAVDDPNLATYHAGLALALEQRHTRSGAVADLTAAAHAGRQALALTPEGHVSRPGLLSNLGIVLRTLGETVSDPELLDESVTLLQQAVAALPDGHPDQPLYRSNLGLSLRVRFLDGSAADDLDDAVACGREAVELAPADHTDISRFRLGLADTLLLSARIGQRPGHRTEAMVQLRQTAVTDGGPPALRARAGRLWARESAVDGDWESAGAAHAILRDILPQLVGHHLSPADRRHHLSDLQGLGAEAAYAVLRAGGTAADAWTALEAGRAILLAQSFATRRDTASLEPLAPQLAAEVTDLRRQLNDTAGHTGQQRRALSGRWHAVLDDIRRLPGFERFALPISIAQVTASAQAGPLVAVIVSDLGCAALIATPAGVSTLDLPDVSRADVDELAAILSDALTASDHAQVDAVLHWLGRRIVGPVLHHLGHTELPAPGGLPRIWWIPTGRLALLPMHAAMVDIAGHTCSALDLVQSSYTPSAQVLHDLREQRRTRGTGALVVGLDTTTARAELPPLLFAEAEAQAVESLLGGATTLLGAHATHAAVTGALTTADIAHFACHAAVDPDDPSLSFLALDDRDLTVAELSGLDLAGAHLAFLSACTTAVSTDGLIDEVLHIASAFQLAGFTHTVATLWPIHDRFAPQLAELIHSSFGAGEPPSAAVHSSVREMRDRYPHHAILWASHIHFGP